MPAKSKGGSTKAASESSTAQVSPHKNVVPGRRTTRSLSLTSGDDSKDELEPASCTSEALDVRVTEEPEAPSADPFLMRLRCWQATPFVTEDDPMTLQLQAPDVTVRPISSTRARHYAEQFVQHGGWIHSMIATCVLNEPGSEFPKRVVDGQNRTKGHAAILEASSCAPSISDISSVDSVPVAAASDSDDDDLPDLISSDDDSDDDDSHEPELTSESEDETACVPELGCLAL
jgi:hypothetical protein